MAKLVTKQGMLAAAAVAGFALGGPFLGRFLSGLPVIGGVQIGPQAAAFGGALVAFQLAKRLG